MVTFSKTAGFAVLPAVVVESLQQLHRAQLVYYMRRRDWLLGPLLHLFRIINNNNQNIIRAVIAYDNIWFYKSTYILRMWFLCVGQNLLSKHSNPYLHL